MDITKLIESPLDRDRADGEIDVISELEKQFKKKNYVKADELLACQEFQEAKGANSDLQCFLVKKAVRNKLGTLTNVDTRQERFALEASEGTDNFLSNFKKYVLPTLIKHNV